MNYKKYTVRKGDNLYSIAKKFYGTLGEAWERTKIIARINSITLEAPIYPGQELRIPIEEGEA